MASQADGKIHELVYGSAAKLLAPGARDLGVIASTRDFPPDMERKLERHRAYTKYAPVPNAIRYIMGYISGRESGFIELTRVVLGIDHTGRPIPFVRHILLPRGAPDKRSGFLMGAINDNADPRRAEVRWIDPPPQFAETRLAPPLAQAGHDFINVLMAITETVTRYEREKRPVLLVQSKPDTGPESGTFMQMLRLIALVGDLLPDTSLSSWVAATHVIEESDRPSEAVILSTYAGTPFHSAMTSRPGSRRPIIVDMEKLAVEDAKSSAKTSTFFKLTRAAIGGNKPGQFAEKCNQFGPSPANYDIMGLIFDAESRLGKDKNLQNVEELARFATIVEDALDSRPVEFEVDSNDKDFLKTILYHLKDKLKNSLTERRVDNKSIIESAFLGGDVPKLANLLFKHGFLRDLTKLHLLEALPRLNEMKDGKNKLGDLLEKCDYLQRPVIEYVLEKMKDGDARFANLLGNCAFLQRKKDIIDTMVEEVVEHPRTLGVLLESYPFLQKPVIDRVLVIKNKPEKKLADLLEKSTTFQMLAMREGVKHLSGCKRNFAEIIARAIKQALGDEKGQPWRKEANKTAEGKEFLYLVFPKQLRFERLDGIAGGLVLGMEILALFAGVVLFFYQFWRTPALTSVVNPTPQAQVPSAVELNKQGNKTQNPAPKAQVVAAKAPETPEKTAPVPQPAPDNSAGGGGLSNWFLAPFYSCYRALANAPGTIYYAPARFSFSVVLVSCIFLIWFNKYSISEKLFDWFRNQKQWRNTIPGYAPLFCVVVFLVSLAFVVNS